MQDKLLQEENKSGQQRSVIKIDQKCLVLQIMVCCTYIDLRKDRHDPAYYILYQRFRDFNRCQVNKKANFASSKLQANNFLAYYEYELVKMFANRLLQLGIALKAAVP